MGRVAQIIIGVEIMSEVNFKCDAFAHEILCDRCVNEEDCEYDDSDVGQACEVYKYLVANME